MMKVCVIIPAYNEAKEIGNIINRLRRQGLEVVVVDDGSHDDTSLIALNNQAVVIKNQIKAIG